MKLKIVLPFFIKLLSLSVISGGLFFSYSICLSQSVGNKYVGGELLLKFKNNSEIYQVKISQEADINLIINSYRRQPLIEFIEPNFAVIAAAFPNDPDFIKQWYLPAINIQDMWSKELLVREQAKVNRKSVIAVLDTGVFINHPDLKDKIWINPKEIASNGIDDDKNGYIDDSHGWDFVSNLPDPNPKPAESYNSTAVDHGTIIAGIAAATVNNNAGIAGTSWFGEIMPLRVLDNSGSGDVYSVVQAINYAVDNGADIINMSFVGADYSQSLYNAIKWAYDKGVIVVAAAGNTNPDINGINLDAAPSYPVCFKGDNGENLVIGVASINKDLKKSDFSSYGSCVDIVAPGQDFYSTLFFASGVSDFSSYYGGSWSGTSLSTPLVSGVLATIKALRPDLPVEDVKNYVLKNTKNVYSYNQNYIGKLGTGLLDAGRALEMALQKPVVKEVKAGNDYIVAGLGFKSFPQIRILKTDGTVFKEFFAYNPNFNGPIYVAAGDVNGDDKNDIITAAGAGGGSHIRAFDIDGHLISEFFAYDKNFRGGSYVTVGDVNGDGIDEIITGPGKGYKPEVRIFDYQGRQLGYFLAYAENFSGGVKVAAGDFNHDGKAEIVTAPGAGGGPQIKIFDISGKLISQFFAFNSLSRGGLNIAVADVHGDNQPEIIASMEKDSPPEIRIYSYLGTRLNSFYSYDPNYFKGTFLAAGDFDNDSAAEIITGGGIGAAPQIKIFDKNGSLKFSFFAFNQKYQNGARPAYLRY